MEELRRCLEEERPPTDEKEDIGVDKDAIDLSINSSFSEDDYANQGGDSVSPSKINMVKAIEKMEEEKKPKFLKKPGEKGKEDDVSFEDIEDVISNPYAEMPEFYSKQIDFDPIVGLPGNQKSQIDHKQKSVLKDKYWDRVLKSVYDMTTAKVPRPVHLTKMLSLYIIHQEKLREQRKEQIKQEDAIKQKTVGVLPASPKKTLLQAPSDAKKQTLAKKIDKMKSITSSKSISTLSRGSVSNTPTMKFALGTAASGSNAASLEIKKRVEKLEKNNIKINLEDLAKETKNLLVRMPPYKKKEQETFSSPDNDTAFPKLLSQFIFSHGFIKKWKGEPMESK